MGSRDYQTWAVQETWRYFESNFGNPVIAMPTGTGKSHVISDLAQAMLYAYPSTRAMVLTHVKELVGQNYEKFIAAWPNAPAGIYSAGLNKKEFHQQVTFAGIASVAKKAHLFGHIDIIFVDECDLISTTETTMYNKFIKALKVTNPHLKVIGLTATPWRAGLGHITNEGGLFTDVCVDMTGVDAFNWFIDEGYLVPLIPKPTKLELDITGVHMRGGELIASELQHAVDKREITLNALKETIEVAGDRKKWLVFASGVDHAKHITEELNLLGVSAVAVYSGMGDEARDDALAKHRAGAYTAIVNNNILTTGYDDPGIDLIVMLRPTGSARLWVQMLGRGTRPKYAPGYDLSTREGRLTAIYMSDKHNCLVLDFAANIRKLGPINDPVIPKQKGKGPPGEAPVKLCVHCNTYNHATVRFCGGKPKTHPQFNPGVGCGEEFIFISKLKMAASTEALIKGQADLPIVERFKVDHITYTLHTKPNSQPMVKATYYCGLQNFTDYVCVEHEEGNYALKRARDWWKTRSHDPMPRTADEALDKAAELAVPTHLSIWINKKYPEIMGYCFDGTNFGTAKPEEVINTAPPPVVTTDIRTNKGSLAAIAQDAFEKVNQKNAKHLTAAQQALHDMDDDIPF